MTLINDLTNRIDRLPLAYGRHVVTGKGTKHTIDTDNVFFQRALGWASWWDGAQFRGRGWQECEALYYQGFVIAGDHFTFHSGGPADAVDTYFPDDIPHPKASYLGGRLPDGMKVDNEPDQIIGIFKTTKTADYNEDGDQIDADGALVTLPDPDDALFYSANPALHIIDAWRRTRRAMLSVNWPVWCAYRDYCAELINWDDGALTPHQVSLTPTSGGSLANGSHLWARIATLKGGDISSPSKDRASDGFTTASVTIGAGGAAIITWASQADRGADGYRVYLGTAEGAEDRYFVVGSGATNTLTVTTLAGATMGPPPEIATGALLRQIPRFESHVFAVPPFDFITLLDKIAQITCMDWQCSGGLWRFYTPEVRDPVFTVNMAEVSGLPVRKADRRTKYDQIIVNYRDLDDEFLSQADPPVQIDRGYALSTFQIDMGCAYRSQAERVGEYWAKRLIDSDFFIGGDNSEFSPKTYPVLPGDTINITHEVPDWEDAAFYIETKDEPEDTKAGYQMTGRLAGPWYSDTDHKPLPRALPPARLNPFEAPGVIVGCTLTEELVTLSSDDAFEVIRGGVTFADFVGNQRGRIWVKAPSDSVYKDTGQTIAPNPGTLESAFELKAVEAGTYAIKVVTESDPFGVTLDFSLHPAFTLNVTGDLLKGPDPADFVLVFDDENGNGLFDWVSTQAKGGSSREKCDLEISVPGSGDFSTVRSITDIVRNDLAQFISWELDPDGDSGALTLVDPAGAQLIGSTGTPGIARSRQKASVLATLLFKFQVPDTWHIPTRVVLCPEDEDPDTSVYALAWTRDARGVGDVYPDSDVGAGENPNNPVQIYADGQLVHGILPADWFYILVRDGRQAEFGVNFVGRASIPLYISPRKIKTTSRYRVRIEDDEPLSPHATAGVRNAQFIRPDMEWLYTADAQKADNSGSLPTTIKARVRQHSFYTSGPPSDWVTETFTRP